MNPILSKPQTFELYTAPGCLEEAALETAQILSSPWKPHKFKPQLEVQKGFLRLKNASWDLGCEIAARASTLHDVRLHLVAARVAGWFDVRPVLERLPWGVLLPEGEPVRFRAKAFGNLPHGGRLEEIAAELFAEYGFFQEITDYATQIRLTSSGDFLRVAVSLGNDCLHKRGWRVATSTPATLREDLSSAALLRLLEFAPQAKSATRVVVPFAGSGTFGIEAWHSLFGLPPAFWGAERSWQRLTMPSPASQDWWTRRTLAAAGAARLPPLYFIENDPEQMRELEQNVDNVVGKTGADCEVYLQDAFDFVLPKGGVTLLPLHPPYGLRLPTDANSLYRDLGHQVQRWSLETELVGFCLCPSEDTWRAFRAGLGDMNVQTSHLTQGGLDVRWCGFQAHQSN